MNSSNYVGYNEVYVQEMPEAHSTVFIEPLLPKF